MAYIKSENLYLINKKLCFLRLSFYGPDAESQSIKNQNEKSDSFLDFHNTGTVFIWINTTLIGAPWQLHFTHYELLNSKIPDRVYLIQIFSIKKIVVLL